MAMTDETPFQRESRLAKEDAEIIRKVRGGTHVVVDKTALNMLLDRFAEQGVSMQDPIWPHLMELAKASGWNR